jgi:hypothetical protein
MASVSRFLAYLLDFPHTLLLFFFGELLEGAIHDLSDLFGGISLFCLASHAFIISNSSHCRSAYSFLVNMSALG